MAGDLRGFALEKAEMLSGRLKELLSSGQGHVQAQLGVDLGLKPELYPTWVVLSTAAAGLLLLLALSWAAVCGRAPAGKNRGAPVTQCEPVKADVVIAPKSEEPKKRNKKKPADRAPQAAVTSCRVTKTQSNGQPVTVAQEEVKVTEVVPKQAPKKKTEKVHEVQAPVQVKKNKKKVKTDVKPVQFVSTNVAKEPEDGAWETQVSNREKRQQRRKDKGPEDSGSSGGVDAPKTHVTATAPTNTKKHRGNHESLPPRTSGKVDTASGAGKVSSGWREEPPVNGVGWTDSSLKIQGQMGAMDGVKWRNVPSAPHYRGPAEPQRWQQEAQAWSGIDGRMKTELYPVSFSMRRLNTSDQISSSTELQWASNPPVDDEWSGYNGLAAAADTASDWNAPAEHWGNYEEPPVLVTAAAPLKEEPAPNKVSEDEKDAEDSAGGAAKSKKKRKKKKKAEEEAASEAQVVSTAPPVKAAPKPQELPVKASKKPNPSISSAQKMSEQIAEPPKPSQKKKVRRET